MAINNIINEGHNFLMPDPECWIFLHHVPNNNGTNGVLILLPTYADTVSDVVLITYSSDTPLSRSAPIYSFSNSGPRSLGVTFRLHRDLMWQLNYSESNALIQNDDYVDVLAREIQAAALPVYEANSKMVNPPLISLKLGNDVFIKGVVSGSVNVAYDLPILRNKKYAQVTISFSINEVVPYSATDVMDYGSLRGAWDLGDRNKWVPKGSYQR